jgi:bacteriorhodopsin
MSNGAGVLGQVGAVCFGIAVGYLTFRALVRTTERGAISVLAAVVGAIGGAAVTGLFAPGTSLFAWYSIGLLAAMAVLFVIFARLNGLERLATVLSIRSEERAAGDGPE